MTHVWQHSYFWQTLRLNVLLTSDVSLNYATNCAVRSDCTLWAAVSQTYITNAMKRTENFLKFNTETSQNKQDQSKRTERMDQIAKQVFCIATCSFCFIHLHVLFMFFFLVQADEFAASLYDTILYSVDVFLNSSNVIVNDTFDSSKLQRNGQCKYMYMCSGFQHWRWST